MAEVLRDLEAINIDTACDYDCANCERYFECTWPQKENFKKHGFLPLAQKNLAGVKRTIIVLGGKGGVGKSMLAVNLAAALSRLGKKVAVLDQNYDCPAVPMLMGVADQKLKVADKGFIPAVGPNGIKVISMGLVLPPDDIIIWFHNSKRMATEEFLTNVDYGELDYMVIDIPAGTSSETVNVMKLIPDMDGAVVITVPSDVSYNVARRAVLICKKAGVPVLGIIENMGVHNCPHCGEKAFILQSGGGEKLARETDVPFWGSIPMDLRISESIDYGKPFVLFQPDIPGADVLMYAAEKIVQQFD